MLLKEKCSIDKNGIYYILSTDFVQDTVGFETGDRLRTYTADQVDKEYLYIDGSFKNCPISSGGGGGGSTSDLKFEVWSFKEEGGSTFTKEIALKKDEE